MTNMLLHKPKQIDGPEMIACLQSDPKILEAIEQSMQARLEGRVRPWSQVKEELGIR